MRRSGDAPRSPQERQRATTDQVHDLARATGRGATAMRDAAGNVLEMNAAAPYPLLTPQGIDGAVAFMPDGTVKMTSSDTTQDRDMTVRDISSSGQVLANNLRSTGEVNANRLTATGQVQADNIGCNVLGVGTVNAAVLGGQVRDFQGPWAMSAATATSLKCGDAENPVGGRITTRELTAEGNIFAKGSIFVNGNFVDNTPSERRLKEHVADVDNGLAVVLALQPAVYRWRDPESRDARRHVGIYVDELADVAPDAIVAPVDPTGIPTENPEDVLAAREQGRGYEDRALIAYLVSAVQQLAARVEHLEEHRDATRIRAAASPS